MDRVPNESWLIKFISHMRYLNADAGLASGRFRMKQRIWHCSETPTIASYPDSFMKMCSLSNEYPFLFRRYEESSVRSCVGLGYFNIWILSKAAVWHAASRRPCMLLLFIVQREISDSSNFLTKEKYWLESKALLDWLLPISIQKPVRTFCLIILARTFDIIVLPHLWTP